MIRRSEGGIVAAGRRNLLKAAGDVLGFEQIIAGLCKFLPLICGTLTSGISPQFASR